MTRLLLSLVVLVGSLLTSANSQVVVSPEGVAGWPAVGSISIYAPLLVTPVAHLETPQPSMGATAAAPGQQIGATSFPVTRVLTPTPPSIIPRVVNAPPTVFLAVPQPEPPLPEPTQADRDAAQARSSRVDLGIAPVDGVGSGAAAEGVAEAAGAVRGRVQAGRTLTNSDVQKLNDQTQSGRMGLDRQQQRTAPSPAR